ncbi:MAG: hypothetical protein ACR2IJ_07525 [Fluviibacter sp.]
MARDLAIAAALIGLGVLIGYILFSKEPKKEYHVIEVAKQSDMTDEMTGSRLNYYERLYAR